MCKIALRFLRTGILFVLALYGKSRSLKAFTVKYTVCGRLSEISYKNLSLTLCENLRGTIIPTENN